jgi:hypothetical protein
MPAVTGAMFAPLLFVCLAGLAVLPQPNPQDIAERVKRTPMDGAARSRLLWRYAAGLTSLIVLYIMLTALRDFRDNFSAEIWQEAGLGKQADIFAWTEVPVSFVVLAALAALMVFRSNRRALVANFALMAFGMVLSGGASLAFWAHMLGPVAWMMLLGTGLYLGYTPFNGILFDRLVASGRTPGNAGFLIYVADSFGYGGTVALLLARNVFGWHAHWTQFLVEVSLVASGLGLFLLAFAWVYFDRRLRA